MSITLKFSLDQVKIMVQLLNTLQERPRDRAGRAKRNILDLLTVRLKKKYIDMAANADLFAPKKKSFKLEYYEANELEEFIRLFPALPAESYEQNLIRLILIDLQKVLA